MTRITCRESGINICIVFFHGLRFHQMARITCGERPEPELALCFKWFQAPQGDTIHSPGVSGISICNVFYMV